MADKLRAVIIASGSLLVGLGGAHLSVAQTATPDQTNGVSLEEIVVTAEKRSENLQKTPVAVDTASQDELVRAGAERLDNIEVAMPDVKFTPQQSGETVAIRGVYSTDNSPTAEQAVSVHIDGAYIAKATGVNGMMFDVSQVEVAKGPQGTLYGRNSNGGTVNIITNKPGLGADDGEASLEYGSYNYLRTAGAASISLGDTTAIRIAFQTLSHNGYMKSGLDDEDEKSGRIEFLWKPDDVQSLLLTADLESLGGKGPTLAVVGSQPPLSNAGGTNLANYYIPANPRDDTFYATVSAAGYPNGPTTAVVPHDDSTNNGLMGQYEYNLGFATWITEASWRKLKSNFFGITNFGSGTPDPTTGYPTAAYDYLPQTFDSQSVETRLTSTSLAPLKWVAGLYGFHDHDSGTMIDYPSLASTTPVVQIANGSEDAKSYAAFGQVVFTPPGLDSLHLTAGARYTHDRKDVSGIFTQFGTSFAPGLYTLQPPEGKSWQAVTWRGGISYDLTQSNLLYASVSTGYKAGGFGYGPGTTPQGPVYAPERIKAYEVGSKNRFFDDRLQVNLEAWLYRYTDYQTGIVVFGVDKIPLPVFTVTSAGGATYQGATLDTEYQITKNDLVVLDLTVLSARYGSFVVPTPAGYSPGPCPAGCPSAPILFDRSNTDIIGVPHGSGTGTYDHTLPLPRGSLDWQVAAIFHGNTLLDIENDPIYGLVREEQKAFMRYDTSLRYDSSNKNWNVTAYVHNLTNGLHANNGIYWTASHLFTESFYDPRIFGVNFSVKFKP